jgi:lysophospholipase L1-like esterase
MALYDAYYYPAAIHEIVTTLGPGGALHADIAEQGGGRYSIWMGSVFFSLPEGKKLFDVARLEVWVPVSPRLALYKSWADVQFWLGKLALVSAILIVAIWLTPAVVARNLGPGLAIVAAMAMLLLAGAEIYLRATEKFPQRHIVWPVTFVPEAGVVFKPNSVVKFTNGVEFWTQETTNSLGYMDHEPVLPKPPDTFRILLVGDSIIEALQVPLRDKTQTVLADALHKAYPDRKIDVVAISRSGLGQGSELGLYKAHTSIRPDLVILMFVANDFANNSILLESIRSGFDPRHPLWSFTKLDENGVCDQIPPSEDWQQWLLAGSTEERVAQLRVISPDYARLLNGLLPQHMDGVFDSEGDLPEIYENAVALTKCSLALWKQTAEAEGFKLMIAATDTVTSGLGNGQIRRLRKIADELGIPLFDMYPEWAKRGKPEAARFTFDGHWSAVGHRWPADALLGYVRSSGYLTDSSKH